MKTEPIAIDFLSDVSQAPDLGQYYEKKLREWIKEETNDDAIRAWFSSVGYPIANPDMLSAQKDFRTLLNFWSGNYTMALDGRFISLLITEDRVELDGKPIAGHIFGGDVLKWKGGELHFSLVSEEKDTKLAGKLAIGKIDTGKGIPSVSNAYGSTIISAIPGKDTVSGIRVQGFSSLDYFNGSYSLIGISEKRDLPFGLHLKLTAGKGAILLDGIEIAIDTSANVDPFGAANGKWNENAIVFHDSKSGYYGNLQFIISPVKQEGADSLQVKGFFGTISKEGKILDKPNVMGVFREEKLPNPKQGSGLEDRANESSIAGTVLSGLAIVIAIGFSLWELKKAKKSDSAEQTRAADLTRHINELKAELQNLVRNTAPVEDRKIDIKSVKKDISDKILEVEAKTTSIAEKNNRKKIIQEEIEELELLLGPSEPGKEPQDVKDAMDNLDKLNKEIKKEERKIDDLTKQIDARHEIIKEERLRQARDKFKR